MDSKNIVSEMDIAHLQQIRSNVRAILSEAASKYDVADNLLLDVAPQDYAGAKEFFKKIAVKTLDINPNSNADYIADLCNNNSDTIADGTFDVVICTEVLEHTLQPFDAVDEIERILTKGGVAIISTPFNFRIHGPLPDCWRFTEHGLRQLFRKFSTVEIKSIETKGRNLCPVHYSLTAFKK